ncbi:MAG: hypothetical protein V7K94_30000 [Nostoc sp.]|uniref:hypothetical protein n=1 Tax=Nostoc sp. TaxID=1180 RepID=UPI002FF57B69
MLTAATVLHNSGKCCIGYVGGTHISEDERKTRAEALESAGAEQVIERMHDLIELLK